MLALFRPISKAAAIGLALLALAGCADRPAGFADREMVTGSRLAQSGAATDPALHVFGHEEIDHVNAPAQPGLLKPAWPLVTVAHP